MRIHREGKNILLYTLIVLLAAPLIIVKHHTTSQRNYMLFAAISTLVYAWLLYFFRDPNRAISQQTEFVLSPADGKIVLIKEVDESEYLNERRIQVSVFISLFNVHVTRSPISGIIKYFKYHPGKYLVAWHAKSSTKNEHTTIVVEHKHGVKILFRQIAGLLARRIKFYPQEGEHIQQGSECGFIKFGSRVDIFFPLDAKIKVHLGEKVQGGVAVLAEL